MHAHIPLDVPKGTPSSGYPLEHKSEGGGGTEGRRGEAEMLDRCPLNPSQCLGMSAMPPLLDLWSLSKVFRFLPSVFNTQLQRRWTLSQSSVIFEFNVKRGTRWQTLCGHSKRSESAGCWNFCLLEKGKEKGGSGSKLRLVFSNSNDWSSAFCPHTPTFSGRKAPVWSLDALSMFSLRRVDVIRARRMSMRAVTVTLVVKIDVAWCCRWVNCELWECNVYLVVMWCSGFEVSVQRGCKDVS